MEATHSASKDLPQNVVNQEVDRLARLKDQKGDIQCEELKARI
jgi:hypothetical protein